MRKIIDNKIVFDDQVKCDKCGTLGAYDCTSTFLCGNCMRKAQPALCSSAVLGEPHLTLTIAEIRDLAGMCGLVVKDATAKEKEDERETEITITPWPATGIKDENGNPYAHAHKHIAYYEEYPQEGCVPLGSPNDPVSLRDVQLNPALLDRAGVTTLAWLAHEAESFEPNGDDMTMMHIDSVLTARGGREYEIFRQEYMRLWPQHAKHRGYAKQANGEVSDSR